MKARCKGAIVLVAALFLVLLTAVLASAAGTLSQTPGSACIAQVGLQISCQPGQALDGVADVAVSPDGRNVYTASIFDGVAVFDRDPTTGALAQKPGVEACISSSESPTVKGVCRPGTGLLGAIGIAVSPDGRSVYVASEFSEGIAIFDRNPANGTLTQKAGRAGCIAERGKGDCQPGRGMAAPGNIAVSRDGKSVYMTSALHGAVAIFKRNPKTGALAQKAGPAGCLSEPLGKDGCKSDPKLSAPNAVAVSPNGKSVYVTNFTGDSVAIFDRNRATGALSQRRGRSGCLSDFVFRGCQKARGLNGAVTVLVSRNGRNVYVAGKDSDSIAILVRNPKTGALSQKRGKVGCLDEGGQGLNCGKARNLHGLNDLVESPDGRSIYASSGKPGELDIFDRNPATGSLVQKQGRAGCVSDNGVGGCEDGFVLKDAAGIALSPDGRNLYVATLESDALSIFDRSTGSR